MILKVKDENGHFKEVILKGTRGEKGDKGDKGDRGEDGTVLQQKEIDNIKTSLDNIEKKNSWYVNIKSYLPDNETDISNALILAVECLNADGGTIILPCDKTYTISSPVTITKNNVIIKSNSQYYNTTIKKYIQFKSKT